jgi:hypothetical protein
MEAQKQIRIALAPPQRPNAKSNNLSPFQNNKPPHSQGQNTTQCLCSCRAITCQYGGDAESFLGTDLSVSKYIWLINAHLCGVAKLVVHGTDREEAVNSHFSERRQNISAWLNRFLEWETCHSFVITLVEDLTIPNGEAYPRPRGYR